MNTSNNDYEDDSVIYDQVTDQLLLNNNNTSDAEYEQLNGSKINSIVFFTKQKALTLNDRLRKSQPIWYLPNLSVFDVKTKLINREIGVSFKL